jgi:hypothetical protein
MLKIRDLGINAIPERAANDGLYASCEPPPSIVCNDCTETGECVPSQKPCEPCTHATGKPQCGPCTFTGNDKPGRVLSPEAIAQLQVQMHQKTTGYANLSV